MAVQIPVFYLFKLVFPRAFSADYGTEFFASNPVQFRVVICFLILAGAACYAVFVRRRFPIVLFAVAWFFVTLIPVLHIFPTYPVVADRYAFLPSFAVFLLAAVVGARAIARWPLRGAVGGTALCVVLAFLSFRQSGTWKDTVTLWEHTAQVSPRSTKALSNLGRFYFIEKGDYDKGLALFRKAQDIDPGNPNYDLFLGGLRIMRGDHRHAIDPLLRALARDPQRMETLINLGAAYEALGVTAKALEYYRRAAYSTQADPAGNVRERAWAGLRRLGG